MSLPITNMPAPSGRQKWVGPKGRDAQNIWGVFLGSVENDSSKNPMKLSVLNVCWEINMETTMRQLEACSIYFSSSWKPLTLKEDCSAHLYFLGSLTTSFFPHQTETLSLACKYTPSGERSALEWITYLSVKNALALKYFHLFSLAQSETLSSFPRSRGRWTAGLCRAHPWTASSPWCPRASAVPAVSLTPARPTPSAMTLPRRAQTSTTFHASAAPPGSNMGQSAPFASARWVATGRYQTANYTSPLWVKEILFFFFAMKNPFQRKTKVVSLGLNICTLNGICASLQNDCSSANTKRWF